MRRHKGCRRTYLSTLTAPVRSVSEIQISKLQSFSILDTMMLCSPINVTGRAKAKVGDFCDMSE
jgi:hypothetical protein